MNLGEKYNLFINTLYAHIPTRVSNVVHHALDYQVDMFLKNFVIYLSKNIFKSPTYLPISSVIVLVRDVAVFVENTREVGRILRLGGGQKKNSRVEAFSLEIF